MDHAAESARLVRSIAARADDAREAEAELCGRFAPRARLYGRRHLRDEERARDLAQAVMLAVIEAVRAGRVEDPERIDRFVLGTCRNIMHRMRDVDAKAAPTDVAELDTIEPATDSEPTDVVGLYNCLAALSARDRAVVYLSFNEGHTADQIAVVLQITPSNVRVLRHRAIAQLRRCMDACNKEGAQ